MSLRSRSRVKASMVLTSAHHLFIYNYIISHLNNILRPILMVRKRLIIYHNILICSNFIIKLLDKIVVIKSMTYLEISITDKIIITEDTIDVRVRHQYKRRYKRLERGVRRVVRYTANLAALTITRVSI